MTRKIFWQEPYRRELEAHVTSVAGNAVTLDRTIFFAFSGGQESGHGTIGGKAVLEARTFGETIVYTLEEGPGFTAGQAVAVTIDWTRQYRLMRLHFLAELVPD